ncbi:MAG TPA: hypothetical protein VGD24_07710 [Gallionella sp.]
MKNGVFVKAALLIVTSLSLLGCTTPDARPKYGAEPEVQAPAAAGQAPIAGTFIGTVTGGNRTKGVGFTNPNVKLIVTPDTGEPVTFFVRSDSQVFEADGKQVSYLESFRMYKKRVSIEYFVIRDATGGQPGRTDFAYEIGQNGVRTLRVLDQ